MTNENKQNTLEIQEKEQIYKKEARQAWQDSCSQDNKGGFESVGFIAGYLAARKHPEGEIGDLKKEKDLMLKSIGCETCYCDQLENELQDRDQRIAALDELVRYALDSLNSDKLYCWTDWIEKATTILTERGE